MAAGDDADVARALKDCVDRAHQLLPRCREVRAFVAAGERLGAALRTPRPSALLDSGARADVSHAIRDVRDVIARTSTSHSPRGVLIEPERKPRRLRISSRINIRAADRKVLDAAAKRVETTAQVSLYKARLADPARLMPGELELVADDSPAKREWEFSLIKSPITPLSARDLDRAPHSALLPALWRGERVSVRVMRRDRARFYAEGDYLWKLGDSPSIPKLLGGHWQSSSPGRPSPSDVGYLIIEVCSGSSLDKLVRQQRLAATLNQLRVLDRIVSALLHAQSVVPALCHQDLHPGNIFLVPTNASSPLSCSLTPPVDQTPNGSTVGPSPLPSPSQTPTLMSPVPPQTTPAFDDNDDAASVGSANSITVNDAPVIEYNAPLPDDASDEEDGPSGRTVGVVLTSANVEPGSPVRSDTTLDARVRRAASTAAARGDVALARGMLSMHSIQTKMKNVATANPTQQHTSASAQSLSQRTAGVLLGASKRSNALHPPASPIDNSNASNSYLVKILDFAPSTEAQGRRTRTSWSNPTIAGYCAPEMATPRMWRRAGDHRQRGKISALRNGSKDMDYDKSRRLSSDSSTTTSSAVVHTPSAHRPASPSIDRKGSRYISRSLSYPRKPAAPENTAEGIMFADEDPFNNNRHNNRFDSPGQQFGKLQSKGDDQPKRMASLYRRVSAHHHRSGDYSSDDPNGNKTHLTGNILGAVLNRTGGGGGRLHGGQQSFDSKMTNGTSTHRDSKSESRINAIGKVDVWSLGWLLYYMASGEHPPTDAWFSSRPLSLIDSNALSAQVMDILRVCVVHDVSRRVSLIDLKRRLESHMRQALFMKGLSLLDISPRHAFRLLDKVVGLRVTSNLNGKNLDAADKSSSIWPLAADFGDGQYEQVELGNAFQNRNHSTQPFENGGYGINNKRPRGGVGGYRMQSSFSEKMPPYRMKSSFGENIMDVRAQSLAAGDEDRRRHLANIPAFSAVGLNARTRAALSTLPLVIVRRVEWEFAARKYECTNKELQRIRQALICERWTKSEVQDGELAIAYLRRRCSQGITSAQSALGWVYRWGAGNIQKEISRAIRLWEAAMDNNDPEAANGLGLIYHHGRRDIAINGKKAQRYYEIAVEQGYPAAAVNLGVMLHDGAAGLNVDGLSAKALYELACENGDAIAANNLGLLLQHGADGIEKDPVNAIKAYELAISRGEKNHARRNLAELLWEGSNCKQVKRNIPGAIDQFARAIEEGDSPNRAASQNKLRALVARDRELVRASLTKTMKKKYGDILM